MQFEDLVRRRRMVRRYDSTRPVPRTELQRLINLANRSPSAGHTQGGHLVVLSDRTDVGRFWSVTTDAAREPDSWLRGMATAPVLVLVLASKQRYLDRYAEPDKGWTDRDESRWLAPYWYVDAGMTAMALLLGTVDAGLGACFFGIPVDRWEGVRTEFSVPDEWLPVGVISIGYAHDDERPQGSGSRGRRPLDETVSSGRFGTSFRD